MPYQQTPQRLITDSSTLPTSLDLALDQIQGDVLIGLQKNAEIFVFFQIAPGQVPQFKTVLRAMIADQVTTTQRVHDREFELADLKESGDKTTILPLAGLNIGFTNCGIQKLVPGTNLGDVSFAAGAKAQARSLNDPVDPMNPQNPTGWLPQFSSNYANIDGVLLITGGSADVVNANWQLLQTELGTSILVMYQETALVRPGEARGHEHFGWLDGVSQPGVKGLTNPFPGQRLLDPGHFVFGYPGAPNSVPSLPLPGMPGYTGVPATPTASTTLPVPWMQNGSFMVFRRLKQLVPEFSKFLLDMGQDPTTGGGLGIDPELLGARLVGRWKSGAPTVATPIEDNVTAGGNPQVNNDFDFADDQEQRRCPFGAHIRKMNPRGDFEPQAGNVDPHRILRAGIPYGPEVNEMENALHATMSDRGLMFVCYQTSISNQFEFLQSSWANNPGFIFSKTHPDGSPVTVGFDPIIGQSSQSPRTRTMDEPISNYPSGNERSTLHEPNDFIVPTAAAYFFVPSINALKTTLST